MTQDLLDFVAETRPFSGLPRHTLGEALKGAELVHLAAGDPVPDPPGESARVHVVRQGLIEYRVEGVLFEALTEGCLLGLDRIFPDEDPADASAVAAEDSVLVALMLEGLRSLLADASFNQSMAVLAAARLSRLKELRGLLRHRGADPFLKLKVGDLDCREPIFVDASVSVLEASRIMIDQGATSCLIRQGEGAAGIVTERDILRKVVATGADPAAVTAAEIMTAPLVTAAQGDLVFETFAKMVRPVIRRMVVVDDGGRPVGILEDRDILSARGENPVHLTAEAGAAHSPEALAGVFAKLRALALRSLSEGIPSSNVGRLISEIDDAIMRRAADLTLAALDGPPPSPFCIAVLGSGGRKEQYFWTDQDNAMVLAPEAASGEGAEWFQRFSEEFIQSLVRIGFPPCPHRVMVNNADWRKDVGAWLAVIDQSIARADSDGILRVSMLADMRHVAGDPSLCAKVRDYLLRRVGQNAVMLRYMARDAVRFTPPIGFFNNLVTEKAGEHKGRIDIKKGGIFALTLGVKTLALEYGVPNTTTAGRIMRLRALGVLSASLAAGMAEAFDFLQSLRAREQAEGVRSGSAFGNFVRPDSLSRMELDKLRDAFRRVVEFQTLLFNKYKLNLFT